MLMKDDPTCIDCGETLTLEEERMYDHRCESCETRWLTRQKVVHLFANKSALEMVEAVASRLRSGESVGVAIVEIGRDRSVAYGWQADHYHLLNSGVARLAAKLALD